MIAYLHRALKRPISIGILLTGLLYLSDAETVYFLIGVPPGRDGWPDSYVLPLSEQGDIDYARYLISAGRSGELNGMRTIVFANCLTGNDGVNRNYVDPKFYEWSWHVSQFLAFGEVGAEILDGTPWYTEYLCAGTPPPGPWSGLVTPLPGHVPPGEPFEIGYYNYTVVRELGPAPLFLSISSEGENLQIYWSAPGTNTYLYTLERVDSLSGGNWSAVPGPWRLQTNHWTLTRTDGPTGFFRVRAEPALTARGLKGPHQALPLRTLTRGGLSGITIATNLVIRTQAEWDTIWR
jgi:hypothetical protein